MVKRCFFRNKQVIQTINNKVTDHFCDFIINKCFVVIVVLSTIFTPFQLPAKGVSPSLPHFSNTPLHNLDSTDRNQEYLDRILKTVPQYNPIFFDRYTAISYRKFQLLSAQSSVDSDRIITDKILKPDHKNISIFAFDSLSQQRILKPSHFEFVTLSAKIQGIASDAIRQLAFQLNNISLLHPTDTILNKVYHSPFSNTALDQYQFQHSDTLDEYGNALIEIAFQPKNESHLNGFIGKARIDKATFSFLSIHAEAAYSDVAQPVLIIDENFEKLHGGVLPSEKNVIFAFHTKNITTEATDSQNDKTLFLIAKSQTQIYQQQINPPLTPQDFIHHPTPEEQQNSENITIYQPFSQDAQLTQKMIDSLLVSEQQEKERRLARNIIEGKLPIGVIDLFYNRILGYNLYEGLRLGLEAETNKQLSKYFTLGGYFSYGLKDQSLRHGESIDLYPTGRPDFRFHLDYKDKNMEYGQPEFLEKYTLLNPENYRSLLIRNMFQTQRFTTGIEINPSNRLQLYFFGDGSKNRAREETSFQLKHPFEALRLVRTGLQIRYSPFGITTDRISSTVKNSRRIDLFATAVQGLTVLKGEYQYTKLEIKGRLEVPFTGLGNTTMMLRGGLITDNAPFLEFFNGYGSYVGAFSLTAPFTFSTMRTNEFSATQFTSFHLRHDFSRWFFPQKYNVRPAIIIVQNMGIGHLNEKESNQYQLQDFRKGFFESGFEVNNLLKMSYLSWGVGLYYRYGPYALESAHNNIAYKFGFYFKL